MPLTKPKIILFAAALLFAAAFFLPSISQARIEDCSTKQFFDGDTSEDLIFPAGGGINTDAKVSLPIGANISAAQVDLSPKTLIKTPYIWIPNSASNTLAQIRTIDGTLVKLYQNGADGFPGSAFSNNSRITLIPGGDVWVANRNNSYVTWLEPKDDGTEEYKYGGQVDMGATLIRGITFDKYGNIWAGTLGSGSDRIKVICANSGCGTKGTVLDTLDGATSYGMIGDKYGLVWVQTGSGVASYKYSSGSIVAVDNEPLTTPYGIGIDNDSNIWIGNYNGWVNNGNGSVYKVERDSSGYITAITNHVSGLSGHGGVAGSGDDQIWAASYGSDKVSRFDTDGNLIANYDAGANSHGVAIDFDNNVWVVNINGGGPGITDPNPTPCGGSGTVTVRKPDGSLIATYPTCGNGPYNYSDMTGFRSIPTAMSVGTDQYYAQGGSYTYKGFQGALQSALLNCSCSDTNGNDVCAVDPADEARCLVPLSLFSVTGGEYVADNLSIACAKTYPIISGGLVPCGRIDDNPDTSWDDRAPCNMCFTFQLIYNLISYAVRISFALAIFMIVIGGLVYALSTGNTARIETAKKIITLALTGIIIIFIAWIIVAAVLALLGYIHPFSGNWNVVDCALPPLGA